MKLLCQLGLHWWFLTRPVDSLDIFPPLFLKRELPRRQCYCGERQQWLPGYGGSEIGCWLPEEPNAPLKPGDVFPALLIITIILATAATLAWLKQAN